MNTDTREGPREPLVALVTPSFVPTRSEGAGVTGASP
jgi:hypothetical protein